MVITRKYLAKKILQIFQVTCILLAHVCQRSVTGGTVIEVSLLNLAVESHYSPWAKKW